MSKLVLAAAAALMLAGPALAAQPAAVAQDAPTQVVSAKGVNFNDPAQVRHFYVKLQGAARAVCQSSGTEDLSCTRRNLQEAVKAVDAPKLTAMLDATYGLGAERNTAFAADAR